MGEDTLRRPRLSPCGALHQLDAQDAERQDPAFRAQAAAAAGAWSIMPADIGRSAIVTKTGHKSVRVFLLALAFGLSCATPANAEASPAFEEARDFVVAGKVGQALLVIGVGAMGINDQDDAGLTLLHYAAKSGSLESVIELLRAGADPKIEAKGVGSAINLASTEEIRRVLNDAEGHALK